MGGTVHNHQEVFNCASDSSKEPQHGNEKVLVRLNFEGLVDKLDAGPSPTAMVQPNELYRVALTVALALANPRMDLT